MFFTFSRIGTFIFYDNSGITVFILGARLDVAIV